MDKLGVITSFLHNIVVYNIPLLYGTVGEIVVEKSGSLNLGVEGIMAVGAIFGYIVGCYANSLGMGIAMAFAAGALCGLLMALGALLGRYPKGDGEAKDRHYRLVQYAEALFKRRTGSLFCYELLGIPHAAQIPVSEKRTEQFYKQRPCESIILAAVAIFDELMDEYENGTLEQKITPEAAVKTTEYLNERTDVR